MYESSMKSGRVWQGHKLRNNVLAPMERWRIGYQTVNVCSSALHTVVVFHDVVKGC